MMDLYDDQTFFLKIIVHIQSRMNVVPVEYVTLDQMFDLIMWFSCSVTDITFRWII